MKLLKYILVPLLIFQLSVPSWAQESFFDETTVVRLESKQEVEAKVNSNELTLELFDSEMPMAAPSYEVAKNPEDASRVISVSNWKATGFVINGPNGQYVVTCNHTFKGIKPDDVIYYGTLPGGKVVSKIPVKDGDLSVVEFDQDLGPGVEYDLTPVQVGDEITTVGWNMKLGAEAKITSVKHIVKDTTSSKIQFFTDGTMDKGRSGSACFNSKGKLVGVYCGNVEDTAPEPSIRKLQVYTKIENLIPLLTPAQYKIKFYSGASCTFCKQQHEITDCVNDKRIIADWTEDKCPDFILKRLKPGYKLPVAVWYVDDSHVSWPETSGVHTIDELVSLCEKSHAVPYVAQDQAMGAPRRGTEPVGQVNAGIYIDQLFGWYNDYLKNGATGSLSLVRSGKQTFNLYGGEKGKLTLEDLLGKSASIKISVVYPSDTKEEDKLPVREVEFDFDLDGDNVDLDIGKVKVYGLAKLLNSKLQVQGAEEPKGFIGIMTLYTIVSTIRTIWILFHPVADLQIGGEISGNTSKVDDDTIIVNFDKVPSLKIRTLMTFNLSVYKIVIHRQSVIFYFNGSRLIKQYTFKIK